MNPNFQDSNEPKVGIWTEFVAIMKNIDKLNYNPWGAFTTEIPDFMRENMKQVAEEASKIDFQYGPPLGMRMLVESIKRNFPKFFFKEVENEEIVAASGAIKLSQVALSTFIKSPEDEIVIFEPYYPYYFTQTTIFNFLHKFRTVPLTYNDARHEFQIDFDILEKTINENTKLLFLCNPNNPTTRVFTKEEYEKITEIIAKYPKLVVIEDVAYFPYLLNNKKLVYFGSISNNFERTITIFSCAKVFISTGCRLGIAIGSKEIMTRFGHNCLSDFCIASPLDQMIYAKNFDSANLPYRGYKDFWEFVEKDNQMRVDKLSEILRKHNLNPIIAEGTYYIICDATKYKGKIPEEFYFKMDEPLIRTEELDKAFCRMMLSEHIGFVPLSECMNWKVKADQFVRISANREFEDFAKVDMALEKIKKSLQMD